MRPLRIPTLGALAAVVALTALVVTAAASPFGNGDAAWNAYYANPSATSNWEAFCQGGGGHWLVTALSVPACGPTGATRIYLTANGTSNSTFTEGFQCVELADRFLYVSRGWAPLSSTNGDQAVAHYAAAHGVAIVPDPTVGKSPAVGTIISFSNSSSFNSADGGHVAVVTATSVNGSGNGSITIVSENVGSTARADVLTVSNWVVNRFGFAYAEWLDLASPPPPQSTVPNDFNGDGSSDVGFLMGLNGGSTGSGALEVHLAYGGGFQSRGDFATTFGSHDTSVAIPFSVDAGGDGKSDLCLVTGVNGGGTGSGKLEVHCAYGGGFNSRGDFATSFNYLDTHVSPTFFADVNGDGSADMCFLTGTNGATTGSGHVEVHCAYGGSFSSRGDFATPFNYISTPTNLPFFADVNGDRSADMCFLTGINGGTTSSGHIEVHCAYGGSFNVRGDFATPFNYIGTAVSPPFFADVNGEGAADMCFLTGVNGATTSSGHVEVHCAYGGGFKTRGDFATAFNYIWTQTNVPFFADVNGDRNADMCFTTGVNGGTNSSGRLEIHCAYGGGFNGRGDFATPFAYPDGRTTRLLVQGSRAPLAPEGVTAEARDGSASVSFLPPVADGGNPVTQYEVRASPGDVAVTGSSGPITVPGLTNGVSYSFTVTAWNAFGPGPPSATSNAVVPDDDRPAPPSPPSERSRPDTPVVVLATQTRPPRPGH
jgi:hypothetical protein